MKEWYITAAQGYKLLNFEVWFCQMAWLSTLKVNEKAEGVTVYYALWIGSTKSNLAVGMV